MYITASGIEGPRGLGRETARRFFVPASCPWRLCGSLFKQTSDRRLCYTLRHACALSPCLHCRPGHAGHGTQQRLLEPAFGNSQLLWAALIGLILLSLAVSAPGWAAAWLTTSPSAALDLTLTAGALGVALVPLLSTPVRLASQGLADFAPGLLAERCWRCCCSSPCRRSCWARRRRGQCGWRWRRTVNGQRPESPNPNLPLPISQSRPHRRTPIRHCHRRRSLSVRFCRCCG